MGGGVVLLTRSSRASRSSVAPRKMKCGPGTNAGTGERGRGGHRGGTERAWTVALFFFLAEYMTMKSCYWLCWIDDNW